MHRSTETGTSAALALLTAVAVFSAAAVRDAWPAGPTGAPDGLGERPDSVTGMLDTRPPRPAPMLLFTDPNKDPDDLAVLVIASRLQALGFIDLRYVLTTLGDAETRLQRAAFAKDVLEALGMGRVEVGAGGDYDYRVLDPTGALDPEASEGRRRDHQAFIPNPFGDPSGPVDSDGVASLRHRLGLLPDGSAVLLVNAGMVDVAALLRDDPDLVRRKAALVVIMGGTAARADESGHVAADRRAYNNTTHQASADFSYRRLQELGVPLIVVTKEAAYAAAAPRHFYDGMAATGHPVGVYLRDQQRQSLANLWDGIRQGHLPPALTYEWFYRTFTDVDVDSAAGQAAIARAERGEIDFDEAWPEVGRFNLYDPLALLAATPGVGERLFVGKRPPGTSGPVHVIDDTSMDQPGLVKDLMSTLAIEALAE